MYPISIKCIIVAASLFCIGQHSLRAIPALERMREKVEHAKANQTTKTLQDVIVKEPGGDLAGDNKSDRALRALEQGIDELYWSNRGALLARMDAANTSEALTLLTTALLAKYHNNANPLYVFIQDLQQEVAFVGNVPTDLLKLSSLKNVAKNEDQRGAIIGRINALYKRYLAIANNAQAFIAQLTLFVK